MSDANYVSIEPEIRDVEIGIRTKRLIKIYPLSLADQKQMTGLITEVYQVFMVEKQAGEENGIAIATIFLKFISDHIETVLKLVTGEDYTEDLMKEITNTQALFIGNVIFKVNYEDLAKKVVDLLKKAESLV